MPKRYRAKQPRGKLKKGSRLGRILTKLLHLSSKRWAILSFVQDLPLTVEQKKWIGIAVAVYLLWPIDLSTLWGSPDIAIGIGWLDDISTILLYLIYLYRYWRDQYWSGQNE